jgi:hypothetical protein
MPRVQKIKNYAQIPCQELKKQKKICTDSMPGVEKLSTIG